jgi:tRNA 2-thiocytidine biosynthesis protein TtcA
VIDRTAFFLSKKIGKAITDYNMIDDGDRILIAVSGGKDSLSLLRIMEQRRSFVPVRYEVVAAHIDMGYHCQQTRALRDYFKKNGYEYCIKKVSILKGRKRSDINCFWCSWNRRKALFELADKLGCRKIALGHHKDDIIETILLNLFFNGEISAMRPKQELFKGKIVIIRPLAYAEEKEIAAFSRGNRFPHARCSCPNSDRTKRSEMERMIKELARSCPNIKTNIFRSVERIKKDYLL